MQLATFRFCSCDLALADPSIKHLAVSEPVPHPQWHRSPSRESSATQAAARAHETSGAPGQWEAAAVQQLRELGAGGELAVKALQKDLVKAARKAMQEQVGRGLAHKTTQPVTPSPLAQPGIYPLWRYPLRHTCVCVAMIEAGAISVLNARLGCRLTI